MDTKKLRQKILDLAIHGKLVPQDPSDEPASVLLERIRAEKEQLIKEGKIKAPKKSKPAGDTSHYPKDVPFEVPKGWEWTEIADISSSINYGVSESAKSIGKYRLLRITDIQDGKVDWKSVPFTDYPEDRAKGFELSDGDILFARTGATVGKSYLVESAPNNTIFASYLIRIQYSQLIIPLYIKFFFESGYYWEQISSNSVGVGQPNVNGTSLGKLRIPLPPVAEQKRIAEEAHRWMGVINRLELEAKNLNEDIEVTKSKILDVAIHGKLVPQDALDEPAIELLRRINPDFTPSDNLHYGEKLPSGWTCGLFGDLNQHRNKSEDPMASPEEKYELYSVPIYETGMPEYLFGKDIGSTKQIVGKGDVLLCKINPHLNRSWVVSHYRQELKCIASSEWLVFSSTAVLPDYARLFFMSPEFKDLMMSNVSGVGGSLMRARASAVNSYPLWVPPINEQNRIVQAVHQFNTTIDSMASILDKDSKG